MYLRPQFTDMTYMGGTGRCEPMTIVFGGIIWSQYTSLNIKFGVNRTFHVLKTTVYRFDLCGRYRTLWTVGDNFGGIIQSQYTNLNIKFGVHRTFHVLKTPVCWFDLFGGNQTLWADDDKFWQCYLELVHKPKYLIWCEPDVLCTQDPSLPI